MNNIPTEELPIEILEAAQKLDIFFKNRGASEWQLLGVQSRSNSDRIVMPDGLHFSTQSLVIRFAEALAKKLADAEKKYGYSNGWLNDDWELECRKHLLEHISKGDPRDVAAYCAFMWHHGWPTIA
jgi:hypothetical protein